MAITVQAILSMPTNEFGLWSYWQGVGNKGLFG